MSIIGKVAKELLEPLAVNVADKAITVIDKVEKIIPEKEEKKKTIAVEEGKKVLVIQQQPHTWKDEFDVFDHNLEIKYHIKGNLLSHTLHIYNFNEIEVATIKKKHLKFRKGMILYDLNDFIFKIDGKKAAVFREQVKKFKSTYHLDNGWIIKGDTFGYNYTIKEDEKMIASIKQKVFSYDTYTVTFDENANELLVLLSVLAMDIIRSPSRKKEIKNTLEHKKRNIL